MRRVATGIVNLGNTCFLSAVLQSLCCVRSFESFLDSLPASHDKRNVVAKLRDSLKALSIHNGGTFNPASLVEVTKLREKFFSGGRQQDAQEFMEDLMSMIDESANPPPMVIEQRGTARSGIPKPTNLRGLDAAFAEFDFAPSAIKRTTIYKRKHTESISDTPAEHAQTSTSGPVASEPNTSGFDETSSSCSDSDGKELAALSSQSAMTDSFSAVASADSGPPSVHSSASSSPIPTGQPPPAALLLSRVRHYLRNAVTQRSTHTSAFVSPTNHLRTHPAEPTRAYLESNPFIGWLGSQLRCRTCNRSGPLTTTRFVDLNLSFPEDVLRDGRECTIEECLRFFVTAEKVSGVRCEHCGPKTADKKMWIARAPKALCLHLRRLVVDRGLRPVKLPYRVHFEETLNLLPFCSWKDNVFAEAGVGAVGAAAAPITAAAASATRAGSAPVPITRTRRDSKGFAELSTSPGSTAFMSTSLGSTTFMSTSPGHMAGSPPSETASGLSSFLSESMLAAVNLRYQLVAVIVHHGTATGGHFTVYRKQVVGTGNDAAATWFHISDERVRQVSWREVQQAEAYMLFYERAM